LAATGFIGPHLVREAVQARPQGGDLLARPGTTVGRLPEASNALIGDSLINDAILRAI